MGIQVEGIKLLMVEWEANPFSSLAFIVSYDGLLKSYYYLWYKKKFDDKILITLL